MTSAGCELKVPDEEVCVNKPFEIGGGAYCEFTLSGVSRQIPEELWAVQCVEPGRVSLSIDAFKEYQSFIEQACLKIKCTEKEERLKNEAKKVLKKYQH